MGGTAGIDQENGLIEDCVVLPPVYGSNCTSICFAGSGRISGNWVYGTNTSYVAAFGLGTANTLLSGNHVLTADWAIRSEVANTNLTVVNNFFQNVKGGVELVLNTNQNLYFAGNTFELATQGAWVFSQWSGQQAINEKIIGNTIKAYGTAGPSFYVLGVDSVTGLIVADNSIDGAFKWYTPNCTNVNIHDNVDLLGNFLTSTNQVELPNSLTRKTVTTSTYNLQYLDRHIGVQSTGTVTINLPAPTGFLGKEYIIVNERTSGTINIKPTHGEKINNSTVQEQITAGFGSRTVTTDGINWFAR